MTSDKQCKNCRKSLAGDDQYCSACGQEYRIGKPTLWSILGDFFSSLLNVDSEIYRSFLAIFRPGKLTTAFLNGRTKYYAPPIRVFIVGSLFFVATLSTLINKKGLIQANETFESKVERYMIIKEIDSLKS